MKIAYVKRVTKPASLAGSVGQERDMPDRKAVMLIRQGYAKVVRQASVPTITLKKKEKKEDGKVSNKG